MFGFKKKTTDQIMFGEPLSAPVGATVLADMPLHYEDLEGAAFPTAPRRKLPTRVSLELWLKIKLALTQLGGKPRKKALGEVADCHNVSLETVRLINLTESYYDYRVLRRVRSLGRHK